MKLTSGMYGFHGWVSTLAPYQAVATARNAATPSTSRRPPHRPATQIATHSAATLSTAVATSSPNDVEPNSRYTGASR